MACDTVGVLFEGRVRRLFPTEHNRDGIRSRVCLRLEDLVEDMETRCWSPCRTTMESAMLPPYPGLQNPMVGRAFDVNQPTRCFCARLFPCT